MSLVWPTCRGAGFLSQILRRGAGDDHEVCGAWEDRNISKV